MLCGIKTELKFSGNILAYIQSFQWTDIVVTEQAGTWEVQKMLL